MYRGILAVLVGALAIAAIGAGCGGSDEDSLTKAEFLKQGSAICMQGDEVAAKKSLALLEAREDSQAEALTIKEGLAELGEEVLVPMYRYLIDELGALPPPSGDEEKVEAILAGLEKDLKEGEAKPELLVERTATPASDTVRLAAEYGLKEC